MSDVIQIQTVLDKNDLLRSLQDHYTKGADSVLDENFREVIRIRGLSSAGALKAAIENFTIPFTAALLTKLGVNPNAIRESKIIPFEYNDYIAMQQATFMILSSALRDNSSDFERLSEALASNGAASGNIGQIVETVRSLSRFANQPNPRESGKILRLMSIRFQQIAIQKGLPPVMPATRQVPSNGETGPESGP